MVPVADKGLQETVSMPWSKLAGVVETLKSLTHPNGGTKMTETMQANKRIWVYLEQEEGQAHPVSWNCWSAAQRLAIDVPGSVVEGFCWEIT